MSKTRLVFLDTLITAASWALIYSFIIVPIYYFYGLAEVYRALLTAVPFFIAQYIRFKVKNFSVFLLFHILLIGGALLLPLPFILKLTYVAFAVVSLIYSFVKRLKEDNDNMTVSFVIFCVSAMLVLTLLCNYMDISAVNGIFVIASVFIILCYLLRMHVYNIDMSLEAITRTTIQPVDKILSFNNKIVLFFLAIVILLTAFSRYYQIDGLIIMIGQLLLTGIRFIVRLFNSDEIPPQEEPLPPETSGDGGGGMDLSVFGAPKTSIVWVILETIMYYLVMIAVAVSLIAVLCYAAYSLYKRFYRSAKDDIETKEFILPEVSVASTSMFGKIKGFMPFFGLSAASRIRQLFYKKVKKQINNGFEMKPYYTVNEIAGSVADKEDLSALTPLYEKARYSNEELTNEDIKSVRK